jgi:hypothetical protein
MKLCVRGGRRGRGTGESTLAPFAGFQGRAARRLGEIDDLICHRIEGGITSDDLSGVALVKANAFAVRGGSLPWVLGCLCGQLPAAPALDDKKIAAILERAHGSSRLLSDDKAGRLLKFTLRELEELQEKTGRAISTLEPYDETPAARALRRAAWKRAGWKRRKANQRAREMAGAKSVTHNDVTSAKSVTRGDVTTADFVTSDVTLLKKKNRDRDVPDVTNPGPTRAAVMEAVAAGAAATPAIVERTGLSSTIVRQTLVRLVADGRLTRTAWGIYALVDERGAVAPAPRLPTETDDDWEYRHIASEASRRIWEKGLDRTIDPSDPPECSRPPQLVTRPQPEAEPGYDEFGDPIPPSVDLQHPNPSPGRRRAASSGPALNERT